MDKASLQELHKWRSRSLCALYPLFGCSIALAIWNGPLLALAFLQTVALACLVAFAICAAFTLTALYRFAVEVGDPRYALAQTALAACLAPVLGIGVVLIPMLVENDAKKKVSEWQAASHPPLTASLLETAAMILIFAVLVHMLR